MSQVSDTIPATSEDEAGAAKPVAGGLLHPFMVRNFNLLFSGQTVSIIGDALYAVAGNGLMMSSFAKFHKLIGIRACFARQVARVHSLRSSDFGLFTGFGVPGQNVS